MNEERKRRGRDAQMMYDTPKVRFEFTMLGEREIMTSTFLLLEMCKKW
jgi:hypothetical protein